MGRLYLEGKCILSWDDDVYSSDEDYYNIMELLVHPMYNKVYEKYYQKQFCQQSLEETLKKNDIIFRQYCDVKHLLEDEISDADSWREEETLFKKVMRDRLSSDEFAVFEGLLYEAYRLQENKAMVLLSDYDSMEEHIRFEF